jgi:hypothetical protein
MKAEPKSLENFLGLAINLGTSATLIQSSIVASHRTIKADMCVAEWSWGSKSKPFVCSSLKSAAKSRQDEKRCTFNIAKCDRLFDNLLQEKQIRLPSGHVIPSSEQLKKHAYYKWHNSYSHATNDCNVLCGEVQSAINEGRLKFTETPQMKLDKDPFLTNMNLVELNGEKVLVRPS